MTSKSSVTNSIHESSIEKRQNNFQSIKHMGLPNPQSFCYLNSVLQMLYSCKLFRLKLSEWIKSNPDLTNNENNENLNFVYALGDLFNSMESQVEEEVQFRVSILQTLFQTSSAGDDIHKCYLQILSRINAVTRCSTAPENIGDQNECKIKSKTQYDESLIDLFSGLICFETKCSCGKSLYSKSQTFKSMPLEVPSSPWKISIEHCILNHFRDSTIMESELSCCEYPNIKLSSQYAAVPQYIFIYLVRGAYRINEKKVDTFIYFRSFIDIPTKDGNVKYKVISVIDHMGGSENGHYYMKALHESENSSKWLLKNDSQVVEIQDSEVCKRFSIGILLEKAENGIQDVPKLLTSGKEFNSHFRSAMQAIFRIFYLCEDFKNGLISFYEKEIVNRNTLIYGTRLGEILHYMSENNNKLVDILIEEFCFNWSNPFDSIKELCCDIFQKINCNFLDAKDKQENPKHNYNNEINNFNGRIFELFRFKIVDFTFTEEGYYFSMEDHYLQIKKYRITEESQFIPKYLFLCFNVDENNAEINQRSISQAQFEERVYSLLSIVNYDQSNGQNKYYVKCVEKSAQLSEDFESISKSDINSNTLVAALMELKEPPKNEEKNEKKIEEQNNYLNKEKNNDRNEERNEDKNEKIEDKYDNQNEVKREEKVVGENNKQNDDQNEDKTEGGKQKKKEEKNNDKNDQRNEEKYDNQNEGKREEKNVGDNENQNEEKNNERNEEKVNLFEMNLSNKNLEGLQLAHLVQIILKSDEKTCHSSIISLLFLCPKFRDFVLEIYKKTGDVEIGKNSEMREKSPFFEICSLYHSLVTCGTLGDEYPSSEAKCSKNIFSEEIGECYKSLLAKINEDIFSNFVESFDDDSVTSYSHLIQDLFKSQIYVEIICVNCTRTITSKEYVYYLSIEFPIDKNSESIQNCVNNGFIGNFFKMKDNCCSNQSLSTITKFNCSGDYLLICLNKTTKQRNRSGEINIKLDDGLLLEYINCTQIYSLYAVIDESQSNAGNRYEIKFLSNEKWLRVNSTEAVPVDSNTITSTQNAAFLFKKSDLK